MASKTTIPTSRFIALPIELRHLIYDAYIVSTPKTIVRAAHGEFMPPPFAYVNRQIREEFLARWRAHMEVQISPETRHIIIAVHDLDFRPGILIWEKAATVVRRTERHFDSVCVKFVMTSHWSSAQAREHVVAFIDWCRTRALPICPDDRLRWTIRDDRRFCRLRQAVFLVSVAHHTPLWRNWRSVRSKDLWINSKFALQALWYRAAQGVAGA